MWVHMCVVFACVCFVFCPLQNTVRLQLLGEDNPLSASADDNIDDNVSDDFCDANVVTPSRGSPQPTASTSYEYVGHAGSASIVACG